MRIVLSPKKKIVFLEHELSYDEIVEMTNNRVFPLSVVEQIFKLRYYYDSNQTLKERKRQPKYYLILMKNGEWRLTYKYENTVYKSIKLTDDLTKEFTLL